MSKYTADYHQYIDYNKTTSLNLWRNRKHWLYFFRMFVQSLQIPKNLCT